MESTKSIESVEEMLQNYNREDPFPGKEALWRKIEAGQAAAGLPARPKRRVVRRAVLAAALLLAVVTTTVFADDIAEAVRQLVHGDITVGEYETLTNEFDGTAVDARMYFEGMQPLQPLTQEQADALSDAQMMDFATADELQAVLPFAIKQPAAPKGYAFSKAAACRLPDGHYLEMALYSFYEDTYSTPLGKIVQVEQQYVGPNCTLNVQTVESLDDVWLLEVNGQDAIYSDIIGLVWVDGDVAYTVIAAGDAEEALRFAEAMYA